MSSTNRSQFPSAPYPSICRAPRPLSIVPALRPSPSSSCRPPSRYATFPGCPSHSAGPRGPSCPTCCRRCPHIPGSKCSPPAPPFALRIHPPPCTMRIGAPSRPPPSSSHPPLSPSPPHSLSCPPCHDSSCRPSCGCSRANLHRTPTACPCVHISHTQGWLSTSASSRLSAACPYDASSSGSLSMSSHPSSSRPSRMPSAFRPLPSCPPRRTNKHPHAPIPAPCPLSCRCSTAPPYQTPPCSIP